MTLEVWELVAITFFVLGALALLARQGLRALNALQIRGLNRDGQALSRWWDAVAEVPAEVLTPPLRRTLGRIMNARLARARRLDAEHPSLQAPRSQITRFVVERPMSWTSIDEDRAIAALRTLRTLLAQQDTARLVSHRERVSADTVLAGHLTRLEFLRQQRASLQPDYLRRVTRALATPAGASSQPPDDNKALPTQ